MTPLQWAEVLDAYRVVPRLLVFGYAALVWKVTDWFMGLSDPNNAQSIFLSVVWGAAAGVFGLYVNSGRKWDGISSIKAVTYEPQRRSPAFGAGSREGYPDLDSGFYGD